MSSPRSQLLDSDALLLMYAAGELPPDEQQALQVQLVQDPSLQAKLDGVRADLDWVERRFEGLDAFNGLASDHAARRAVDAIRSWQLGRPTATEVARPLLPQPRRWGWASSVAAVVAVGFGVAALVTYLNPPSPQRVVQLDGLPDLDAESSENALALHAATSLAIGLEVEDDTASASPMPPNAEEAIVTSDQAFFEVPLIADADDGAP